jgi:hypothetical protein
VAFRRAFAPVAVAGMVLVLVGGVGATGALGPAEAPRISLFFGQQAASAPDPAQPEMSGGDELQTDEDSQTDDAGRPAAASAPPADGGVGALGPTPTARGEINPLPAPEEPSAPTGENLDAESTLMSGWILLLAAGIALLAVAAALRALPPKGSPSRR